MSNDIFDLNTRFLKKNHYVRIIRNKNQLGIYLGKFNAKYKLYLFQVNKEILWLNRLDFRIIGLNEDYFYCE